MHIYKPDSKRKRSLMRKDISCWFGLLQHDILIIMYNLEPLYEMCEILKLNCN